MRNEIICTIKIRANTLLLVQQMKSFREIESFRGEKSRIHSFALHYKVMGAANVLEMSVHSLASLIFAASA